MHPRGVPPDEKRSVRFVSAVDEVQGSLQEFLINGLHAFDREWAGVLDFLSAIGFGPAMEHTPGSKFLFELGIFGIVRIPGLLLGVEVVEVAEELVKAMDRGQVLVAIAEVVFAELAGGVSQRLEEFGDRRIFRLQTEFSSGKPHL